MKSPAVVPLLSGAAACRWIDARGGPCVDDEARAAVAPVLADVRARGDAAVKDWTERFDGARVEGLTVPTADRRAALGRVTPERRRALERARAAIEAAHRAQERTEPPVEIAPGLTLAREFRPLDTVGLYAPGGRADYPSTVLMCGVPAKLAGCRRVVLCSPPRPNGRPPDSVLAAAELLSLDAVYAAGGAQAIAALAYGTETIPRVDKIFGPGNRYVTAAKELVYGTVDIDMPAGPSEIVIVADATADPRWIAADLVAQAEHAPEATAVGILTDGQLARRVAVEVAQALETLPLRAVATAALTRSALLIAGGLETAADWANALAPEHVTIVARDGEAVLRRIRHAGSVFLGPYAPVAAGDYATGSNHVLPTATRSRAWSALSLADFGRWMPVQRVSAAGLAGIAETATALARWEGFEGHARSIEVRFERRRP